MISVLSYNIHKGYSPGNIYFVLNKIKKQIEEINPDIVFLQEVAGNFKSKSSDHINSDIQYNYIAQTNWEYVSYGKNRITKQGHFGNAILSKFKIHNFANTNISTNIFEKRGFLSAQVAFPSEDKYIYCFCVHLNLMKKGRLIQLNKIGSIIKTQIDSNSPFIFAGDFNDWSLIASKAFCNLTNSTEVFKTFNGDYAKSFPAALPVLKLDRIYTRGFKPLYTEVLSGKPWNSLSDHAPIYAKLELTTL